MECVASGSLARHKDLDGSGRFCSSPVRHVPNKGGHFVALNGALTRTRDLSSQSDQLLDRARHLDDDAIVGNFLPLCAFGRVYSARPIGSVAYLYPSIHPNRYNGPSALPTPAHHRRPGDHAAHD